MDEKHLDERPADDELEPAIDSAGVPLSYASTFERGAGARLRGQSADSLTYKTSRHREYWRQGWKAADRLMRKSAEAEREGKNDDRILAARRDRRDVWRLRAEVIVAIGAVISAVFLWRQVEQQASDTLAVRRAQLLETIDPGVAQRQALAALIEISPGVFLTGADLRSARLMSLDLSYVNLHHADLSNADLSYGKLTRTPLSDAILVNANLVNANLAGTSLERANLTGADLANANLTRTLLTDANLSNANLTDADLRVASLHGADLATARITQEQLDEARGNAETKLPPGLKRPAHWPTSPEDTRERSE